jgi:hypothetical protein
VVPCLLFRRKALEEGGRDGGLGLGRWKGGSINFTELLGKVGVFSEKKAKLF